MQNSISKKSRLSKEIVITLIIKFAFIYILWWLFFSNPMDKTLDSHQIQSMILDEHTPAATQTKSQLLQTEDN